MSVDTEEMNQQFPSLPCRASLAVNPSGENWGFSNMSLIQISLSAQASTLTWRSTCRRLAYLDALNRSRFESLVVPVEAIERDQAVLSALILEPHHEIVLDVELRIFVFLIHSPAISNDPFDLRCTGCRGFLV